MWYNTGMTVHDILSNAFVVTSGGTRLAQFRKCLDAVGLDGSLPREWRWCRIEGEGSMGNAVAQYSLVRHALESKMPFLVVFEDDAVPCDDAGEALVRAFESRAEDTLCLSLGWSYDSDPGLGDDRGAKRRVYGSQAYALFGERAYLAYIEAWERNGRADVVLGLVENSKLAPDNMFAQHTPADAAGIHLPPGWSLNAKVEAEVDKEAFDRFSKVRAACEPEMHVAYTVDIQGQGAVQFADQLLVSLFSLRASMAPTDRVCVHVLYGYLPGDLVRRLYALSTPRFRVELKSIPSSDLAYMQQFTKGQPGSAVRTWSGIVFARLWIPRFLPDVDRVVYTDADTFVRRSLKELWETDLGGCLLGCPKGTVPEYGFYSGLMVMDCAAMRAEKDLYRDLHKFMAEHTKSFYLPDQTTVNRFFAGRIKEVSMEWCYPPKPGASDGAGMKGAAIWHFYEGGKPRRLAVDDYGRAWTAWLDMLRMAEAATDDIDFAEGQTNNRKGA